MIPYLMLMDMPVVKISAGETVLKEGDSGKSAYVLQDGEMIIQIDGKEITSVSERGSIFGEMSTLLDLNRGATVITTKESSFYVIDDLQAFLSKNHEFSYQLLRLMAQRIDEMNSLVIQKRKWWNFY